ncbi:MAG TPA: rhodanese-like domain-containing protein, partial [Thermoanaerobaculia bacterium]|nr:rhodanese-like domain-containing protein [Thermoanaerobaculia bacterium]
PATVRPNDLVERLTPQQVQAALRVNEAIVVDVRGDVPYSLEHVRGAVSIPIGLIRERATELSQEKLIVTYCTCKLEESSSAAALEFQRAGFPRVAVLEGGTRAWREAGLPVDLAPPDPEATPMPPPGMTTIPTEAPVATVADRGRMMPPPQIRCERNDVTVYNGRVLSYSRKLGKTTLRIRTDSDTTERVTLTHPKSSDPSRWFLVNGQPFRAADWKRIEQRKGVLRAGMRANAWVCTDGKAIVDWRPDETAAVE